MRERFFLVVSMQNVASRGEAFAYARLEKKKKIEVFGNLPHGVSCLCEKLCSLHVCYITHRQSNLLCQPGRDFQWKVAPVRELHI